MILFYLSVAFIIGLATGWWLCWARWNNGSASLQQTLASVRRERDRTRAENILLNDELAACQAANQAVRANAKSLPNSAQKLLLPVPVEKTDRSRRPKAVKSPSPVGLHTAGTGTEDAVEPKRRKKRNTQSVTTEVSSLSSTRGNTAIQVMKNDDLRRLIGIGPVNERRLIEHGISTYAQIAAWNADDIRYIEEHLKFDGRIDREKWVEQAKLLASGKEQEFMHRFPNAGKASNT